MDLDEGNRHHYFLHLIGSRTLLSVHMIETIAHILAIIHDLKFVKSVQQKNKFLTRSINQSKIENLY